MKTHLTKFILIALIFIGSCNKDENNDTPTVSSTYSITLAGQINDENGQGIPNVTVQVGNKTDQTDGNGIYLIEKASVNKSRAVVKATKTGYWNRSSGFIPSNSTVQYCNFVMPQKAAATSIQSSTGGSVTSAGATVVFPVNAFVTSTGLTYNGTVNITSKHLPTSDPNFGALIPGGDLMAEDTTGNSVKLISYGMIGVEIKDNNGNPLQLGPGIKANIQLPIASAQLSIAPATIPLWYFDETKTLWIEEGIATKQGNNYVGQVGHFSWWNCDQPTPAATISGYVYDNYGNPIVNATIYYNNVAGTITDQTGFYSGQVNSGLTASIYATFIGNNSPLLNIPSLSAGQLYNVPDIIINGNSLGRFKANFVNCNNQPANTYVKFSGTTSNSFIYAPNGIVNTIIQCGAQTIIAFTSNSHFDSTFIQPCLPDSIDLGTVSICTPNAINVQFFSFNMSFNNINYNYYDDYYVTANYQPQGNAIYINSETINPSETAYLTIADFFTYAPGTYTISNAQNGTILLDHWGNGFNYTAFKDPTNSQPSLTLTILQSGISGDTLEFTLQGNVNVMENGSGLIYTGTINSMHLKCLNF